MLPLTQEQKLERVRNQLRELNRSRDRVLGSVGLESDDTAAIAAYRKSEASLYKSAASALKVLDPKDRQMPEAVAAVNEWRFATWKMFHQSGSGFGPPGPIGRWDGLGSTYVSGRGGGVSDVPGGFMKTYRANEAALGLSLSDAHVLPSGDVVQAFERGSLMWHPDRGVTMNVVRGGFATVYPQNRTRLGAALTNEQLQPNGDVVQRFERGALRWNPSVGLSLDPA